MNKSEKAAGKTAKKETALERVQRIGRERAYYNRENGGIILTAEQGRSDYNGVHWRVLLDGGNYWNGRQEWIAGRASGGGYNVRAAALAEAVCGVIGHEIAKAGYDYIGWHNGREWSERAKAHGWTLYLYGNENAVVLIPSAEVAEKIAAEIKTRQGC